MDDINIESSIRIFCKKPNAYEKLALAIVASAIKNSDTAFFITDWGDNIMTLAGVINMKEEFIKQCQQEIYFLSR